MRFQTTKYSLKLGFLTAALTITLAATNAFGDWLQAIPLITVGTATDVNNQAYGLTEDGKYVVGQSYSGSTVHGFLYNVATGSATWVNNGGPSFTIADGVTYRNNNTEVVISGVAAGWRSEFMTTDGGLTYSAPRRLSSGGQTIGGSFNQVKGPGGSSDQYYIATRNSNNGAQLQVWQMSGPWIPSTIVSPKDVGTQPVRFNGISGTGRAVGRRVVTAGTARNYVLDYNGTSGGGGFTFNGLSTVAGATDVGEAWAVSANGLFVGGASPRGTETAPIMAPYLAQFSSGLGGGVASWIRTDALPLLGDPSLYTSTTKGWVYDISANGHYVAGFTYPGSNHAVVWDTKYDFSNPANWVCIDLMAYAQATGIMDGWVSLQKAYSVGEDPLTGAAIVSGFGTYFDGTSTQVRAFVMEIPEPSAAVLSGIGLCALLVFRRKK